MKPNYLVIIAVVALLIVGIVWYSSAGSSGLATANIGETGMGGSSIGSLIGAGGSLLGGIVDTANSGSGTTQQPRIDA